MLLALLLSAPLAAQDGAPATDSNVTGEAVTAERVTADEAIAAAKAVYGPPDSRPKPACPTPQAGDEIVVCGKEQDNRDYRVQSSSQLDPTGTGARDSVPRAPDVGTAYPGIVVAKGCFIPPCPPAMPVLIDLKAIPEAPPGSDADRVAHGFAPRGGSGTAPPPAPAPAPTGSPEEAALRPPESASPAEPPSG